MAPIRVALIGLPGSPPDKYEGTAWTANAHLPYLKASPHYEVVALLNTSVETAKAAIQRYDLPPDTKAYGNPDDLAADTSIDLIVCSVRVDRHFQTIRSSILAGSKTDNNTKKAIYVEWPLEANLSIARSAASLAKENGIQTIVGLQAQFSPQIRKLKEVIDRGRIGRVISSSWLGYFGNAGGKEGKNVRYFLDREVGGNVISIGIGHSLEFLNYVLGDFKSFDSSLSIGHPTVDIIDRADGNKVIVKDAPNTVPDQVIIQGTVTPSDAVVSFQWVGGPPYPGTPGADWRITGTKGSLRLTSSSWSLNVGRPDTKIELFDAETGNVEVVQVEKDEWDELPVPAGNIGRLYEAYRKRDWFPDWDWALKRHEFLEELWKRFDEGK